MPSLNIHLDPVSNPGLDTIPIDGPLFPIGRAEPFFASLPNEVSAKLSRRHARIFQEQGKVYLTDLDSRNGTTLNGKNLKGGRPEVLRDGDLIEFAGDLSYRINLDDPAANTQAEQSGAISPQLILKPVKPNSGLDVIVVNQFPFLIARKSSLFERYSETLSKQEADQEAKQLAKQVEQISRRHAVVTLRDEHFYIEDLGSKNGTEVNGQALGEHSRQIFDGDTLAFGGKHFVYSAVIPATDKTAPESETVIVAAEYPRSDSTAIPIEASPSASTAERTMFVDSPASFLDIFCTDDDEEDEQEPQPGANKKGVAEPQDRITTSESPGKFGLLQRHAKEIGRAFRGETEVGARISKRATIGIAVSAIAILLVLLYPSDAKEIKKLSARGYYTQSVQLANRYLSKHPQDTDIQLLATKSLINSVVPDWLAYLHNDDYGAASELLKTRQAEFPNIAPGIEYLGLLRWVGELQQFSFESGGIDGPIDIFNDEIKMKDLLSEWNRRPNRHRQILAQVSAITPQFEPLQKKTLSQVRQLRHSYSLYGNAIDALSSAAINGIASGNMEYLLAEIDDSRKNYPRLSGLDALRTDAVSYQTSLDLLNEEDLGILIEMQRKLQFETSLFQTNAEPLISKRLPDAQMTNEYERALGAWKSGEAGQAIEILGELEPNSRWSSQVNGQIERFQAIELAFVDLTLNKNTDKDKPAYQDKLLAFRKSLKPAEDSYYTEATNADFDQLRESLIVNLKKRYEAAKKQWGKYRQAGGISSVMRIEDPISRKYKVQAKRLMSAFADISTVVGGYKLLQTVPPMEIPTLDSAVLQEISRQRSWINNLEVVLNEQLLRSKLELLRYRLLTH